jgi:hypothetical protein
MGPTPADATSDEATDPYELQVTRTDPVIPSDWKLKLRYGKLETPFHPYAVLVDGIVGVLPEDFGDRNLYPPGPAVMSLKIWAESPDQAVDVAMAIAHELDFKPVDQPQVYTVDPDLPPSEDPSAYRIRFTPHGSD